MPRRSLELYSKRRRPSLAPDGRSHLQNRRLQNQEPRRLQSRLVEARGLEPSRGLVDRLRLEECSVVASEL